MTLQQVSLLFILFPPLISLIFGLLLFIDKERSKVKDIAGGCLIAVFALFLMTILADNGTLLSIPTKMNPSSFFPPLFLTALSYLYLFEYTRPGWINLKRSIILLAPGILAFVFYAVPAFLTKEFRILQTWQEAWLYRLEWNVLSRYLALSIYLIYFIGLPILYKMLVRLYRSDVKVMYSQEKTDDLHWLGTVLFYYIYIGLIFIIAELTSSVYVYIFYYISYIAYPPLLYFYANNHKSVFADNTYSQHLFTIPLNILLDQQNASSSEEKGLQGNNISLLDKQTLDEDPLLERLDLYMKEQKPYLDPDLSLASLASALFTNRTYLSNLINSRFSVGFYDYINACRVEESKKLMADDQKEEMKINEIASHCGFSNARTFYRVFKKETGLTPGDYRFKLKENL